MQDVQHHPPWWEPPWFVLSVYFAPHLTTFFAAEPQTDDSDSEGGFFDYEDASGLDGLGSDIELQPDAASSDGEYASSLPISGVSALTYVTCVHQSL